MNTIIIAINLDTLFFFKYLNYKGTGPLWSIHFKEEFCQQK